MNLRTAVSLLVALALLSAVPRAAWSEESAEFFVSRIRPLITTLCLSCHATETKKGGLDIERFATLDLVRADLEAWQGMLEMLENDEMPPEEKPRPRPEDRHLIIRWIRELLEREARLRVDDPGPALVRRLNNAEYTYTIRDLTGAELRPARHFPADGAAGEGFLNATDALALSPELMSKYLDAAKEIAAHAVLLPDDFRFSTAKFKEDWVNEVLTELRELHAKYATDTGEIPLDRYLKATIVHHGAIRSGKTSIAQIASTEKLSPKYLRILWQLMTDDRTSILLSGIRARWNHCVVAVTEAHETQLTPDHLSALLADILNLQSLLWHKQEPRGEHALEDRHVAAVVSLTERHTYKLPMPRIEPGDQAVFYLAAQAVNAHGEQARVILQNPHFASENAPPLSLCKALQLDSTSPADETAAPPRGISRIDASRFTGHPSNNPADERLFMQSPEVLEVKLPGSQVSERTFVVEVHLDPDGSPETLVRFDVRHTPTPPQVERGLMWEYREGTKGLPLLSVRADDAVRDAFAESADQFRRVFPARLCYPDVIVRDTTVTLERFHRGDGFLSRLMLDDDEHARLERLWEELHYISRDALQVSNSLSTLTKGEMTAYKSVQDEIIRRAEQTQQNLLASEPKHVETLLDFAARAYRRPLTEQEQRSLRDLYQSLRREELPHEETFRAVLARVLVSPNFLYRIERPVQGIGPQPVTDWELATRLSYFLWSATPDEELRQAAATGRLREPQVLERQTRRMLEDPRSRGLAIEFGAQWLEVRGFDEFQGKDEQLFPTFDDQLRRAMYEETILFFRDMFQSDRPIGQLIDADHTFLNEILATHYGIPGVRGKEFRRFDGVRKHGRGGMLGWGSVLAKHSGAARTSPVLRGNWIAEILLGERLPRPPDEVPKLPEQETSAALTIRQLVEQHAQLPQCAVCHQRIDPLGFALEQYDTIGRWRDNDLGGRPVDARAQLQNDIHFEGIDGLRQYILTQRKDDFVRQFCRKLLGYALGRRLLLSDGQLLEKMAAHMEKNDGRLSSAVLAIVHSKQFQYIRGSESAE